MSTALEIKVARIKIIESKNHLKAFAYVSFNDSITIKNIKVLEDDKGLFVSMPQELNKNDGKWYDTIFCHSKEIRDEITNRVLTAYNCEVKG